MNEIIFSKQQNFKVDNRNPTPLYHQLYLYLRELIVTNQLHPGEMLPPEIDLAKHFLIGRQTVRRSLSKLVDEGLVERYSGRGTFVKTRKRRENFYFDRSFTQQLNAMGLKPHAKVLEKETGIITTDSPAVLQRRLGGNYMKLKRIRYGDDIPIGVQTSFLITDLCPNIEKNDFSTASLFDLLSSAYNLEITEIHNEFSAGIANTEQAGLLDVEIGTPLLLENTITFISNGEPIETTTCFYRTDNYKYSIFYEYKNS